MHQYNTGNVFQNPYHGNSMSIRLLVENNSCNFHTVDIVYGNSIWIYHGFSDAIEIP